LLRILETSEDSLENKKKIKERYNELGHSLYDLRYSEEQQEKYKYILEEFQQPDLLLDNGCGTGLLFKFLSFSIVGIDISAILLEKARQRLNSNHHLVLGDSENLPFRNKVFDMVISITVIQNSINPKIFTEESVRVSKLGSKIIISSLKRVYSYEDIVKQIENDNLKILKVLTNENINDWITISSRIR